MSPPHVPHVLVTSAGTASALSVIKALTRAPGPTIRVLAVDTDPTAAGLRLASTSAIVPRADDPRYIDTLLHLCTTARIDTLIPIYSREIETVAAHADRFHFAGVRTLLSPPEVIRRANDKLAMAEFVRQLNISSPEFHLGPEWPGFPLIGKPNRASGSAGHCQVDSARDWYFWKERHPDYLFQRRVTGIEYTVDVLCDRQSQCVVCSPRSRLLVKAGQSVKGTTESRPQLEAASRLICARTGIVGPANLQFFENEHGLHFIELNPRFAAGGLMLTVEAGGNIPRMVVSLAHGEATPPVKVTPGITMIRYWEEMFTHTISP